MTGPEIRAAAVGLAAAVAKLHSKSADVVPIGWVTSAAYAAAAGFSTASAKRTFRRLGLKRTKFRVKCGSKLMRIDHYYIL